MKEKKLLEELKSCVDDWGDNFDIDLVQEDYWKGNTYFSVIITHKSLGHDYEFRARVSDEGDCEMDYNEDSWTPINMGNLFAWMWFDTAPKRAT